MYVRVVEDVVEQYPFSIQTLKEENPNTSFPNNIEVDYASLAMYNVFRVSGTAQPQHDRLTSKVIEDTPVLVDGIWTQKWTIVPLTQEEIESATRAKSEEVRAQRNNLLQECDWTQYKDISEELSVKWQPYRQALRDVPKHPGFPYNVEWPVKPE